jgi:Domain of unknown function (DUF4234)
VSKSRVRLPCLVAQKISIPGSAGTAKIRHPWGVFFLALITLGIYYLYWYYQANRELRDYGVGESPFRSLLALFPGGLIIIPPFVSWWRFFGRLREAQERAGKPRCSFSTSPSAQYAVPVPYERQRPVRRSGSGF